MCDTWYITKPGIMEELMGMFQCQMYMFTCGMMWLNCHMDIIYLLYYSDISV